MNIPFRFRIYEEGCVNKWPVMTKNAWLLKLPDTNTVFFVLLSFYMYWLESAQFTFAYLTFEN